ncbi:flagellar hook-associated protein 3 FlgL [Lachnospiraceae bacterium]|nr:flagellar hook-associated protein 3 FlgL [Lachnospiraceae bacterium]
MRITNKMINNNSVYNINNNMEYMDELNTQMATQKKFNNPSDDPITAIRSLRFRGSLASITQYLTRNVSDGVSWAESTQTALKTAKNIMEDFKKKYSDAVNTTKTNDDRRILLQGLQALAKEYFAVGNSTNEDRYIFTGYRTSDSFTFTDNNFDERKITAADKSHPYQYVGIAEHFTLDNIERYSYTSYTKNGTNYSGITDEDITAVAPGNTSTADETQVKSYSEFRLRLSYSDIDVPSAAGTDYAYTYPNGATDDITTYELTLKTYDSSTNTYTKTDALQVKTITSDSDATFSSPDDEDTVYLNTVTGNLIFTSKTQQKLAAVDDIEFAYDKKNWDEGDVKPEHFFCCTDVGDAKKGTILYDEYLQEMNYTVGSSQSVKVNTNARDAFDINVLRDLEELSATLDAVDAAQSKVDKLKTMSDNTSAYASDDEQAQIAKLLAAAEKELDYATQKATDMISSGITKSQDYFNRINLAGTTCGTTINRLDVIQNRLTENQTTVKAQASDNENADLSTLAVEVSQANVYYNAALMVTGKISQQSLVDYI